MNIDKKLWQREILTYSILIIFMFLLQYFLDFLFEDDEIEHTVIVQSKGGE